MSNNNSVQSKGDKLREFFPNIAGYEKVREEGAQIIDIIQRKDAYAKVGARCPRGWFFYGDPGMGKTQIVKDISNYVKFPIIEISSSDAIKRKVTIDEDIVNGFAEALKNGNSIIFIDEMDKFAGYKKYAYEVSENLKTQKILLHELDQIKDRDDIIVIATGNRREYLDDAILRSGRFDRQVLFSRPNAKDRCEIIKHFLKSAVTDKDVDIRELVRITAGRSCAEIECIVNEAKISAVSRGSTKISLMDFTSALNRVVFNDIPKEDSKDAEQSKLIAYHEAGHALMGYLLQPESLNYASIIPQGSSSGKVKMNADDDFVKEQKYYEELVKIALSGMISVKVMTGFMTGGNKSDIEKAYKIVCSMVDDGFYGLEYVSFPVNSQAYDGYRFSPKLTDDRGKAIVKIIDQLKNEVEEVLLKNKPILESLALALVEKKELSSGEIVNIIKSKI
ncbi:MAG: AAA family ATPase [Clostridia bacterium]|nr:AAA family ATPase [Clostridia bacterium]